MDFRADGNADGMEQLISETIDQYAQSGIPLTRQEAMDEIAADYAANELMTDPESIQAFVNSKPKAARSFWQKLRNAFKQLRKKIDGTSAAEKKILRRMSTAERLWADAFQAASERANGVQQTSSKRVKTKARKQETTKSLTEKSRKNTRYAVKKELSHAEQQFNIIQSSNPMHDDVHTGIRSANEIMTFQEVIEDWGYGDDITPDFTWPMVEDALESGKITVYSSYPIEQGVFVSPSLRIARDYAGSGHIYERTVLLADVAWIDATEGQYASVEKNGTKYSVKKKTADGGSRMTEDEIKTVQSLERKSLNRLTEAELKKLAPIAERYYRTMGEKSPFFRAWFGDWRVNDQTSVQVATKEGSARGLQHNADTGWDISVSGKVFSETQAHQSSSSKKAYTYTQYLNDIVEKAVLLDSSTIGKTKSQNSLLMHSLYAVADIGNKPVLLRLYVEEMYNPNESKTSKRAYKLNYIEQQQSSVGGSSNNVTLASSQATAADVHTVSDLFALVKRCDKKFSPKAASQIVNEDGSPKIMYHQTDADFSVFRTESTGAGRGDTILPDGAFFKSSDTDIGVSGQKQMRVYLNVRNPLRLKDRASAQAYWEKHVAGYKELMQESQRTDALYNMRMEQAEAEEDAQHAKLWQQWRNGEISEEQYQSGIEEDASEKILQEWKQEEQRITQQAKQLLNDYMHNSKYDGIILAQDEGGFGRSTDSVIAFSSNQVKSATDNVGTFDRKNADIRYSVKTQRSSQTATGENAFKEDKYYQRQLDQWEELRDGTRIKVGIVQENSALNKVGIPAERVFYDISKIRKTMDKHGNQLSIRELKQIPALLGDPIVITEYEGAPNTVNVYGNLFTAKGAPIVVGMVVHTDIDGSTLISNIRTVHPRSNYAKQITDASVLYLNEDKKRTRTWFHVCDNLKVPLDGTMFGFIRSITYQDTKSNRYSVKSRSAESYESEIERLKKQREYISKFPTHIHDKKPTESNQSAFNVLLCISNDHSRCNGWCNTSY